MSGSSNSVTVSFSGASYGFTWNGSAYVSNESDGSALNAARTVFTADNGMVINFVNDGHPLYYNQSNLGRATSIVFSDGTNWLFTYKKLHTKHVDNVP